MRYARPYSLDEREIPSPRTRLRYQVDPEANRRNGSRGKWFAARQHWGSGPAQLVVVAWANSPN